VNHNIPLFLEQHLREGPILRNQVLLAEELVLGMQEMIDHCLQSLEWQDHPQEKVPVLVHTLAG
tara:strand:+ start:1255 stop:1446 length:192 start_codon:yes stop_codon:yes gene_type:complete